jgi:hypothetical protein
VAAAGLGLGCVVSLVLMCAMHAWLFDASGHPMRNDFLVFQSAGNLALHGAPLSAYSTDALHAEEVTRVGHGFARLYPWQYPPLFFFVAVPLACLPFAGAFIAWIGTMLPLYGGIVATIAKSRLSFLASWAPPWAILATMNGQNGFLTASIIGLVLVTVEKRPRIAGLILGLLSYKPQFAFLFPFALAFGGYWSAFGWACVGTLTWTTLACAVFGFGSLIAFLHNLTHATNDVLTAAGIGWDKLQSVYGLCRWLGMSGPPAWVIQICTAAGSVVLVSCVWRSRQPFELKAACLVALIPLVTPYAFIYDFPLLTIAIAFLYRHDRFSSAEVLALAAAVICTALFVWHSYPAGLFASLAIGGVVLRRCVRTAAAYECRVVQFTGPNPHEKIVAA